MKVLLLLCLVLSVIYSSFARSMLKPRVLVADGPQTTPVDESKPTPTISSSPANTKGIRDDDEDNGFDSQGGLGMINDAQWMLNERTKHQRIIITIRFQTATLLVSVYKKNVFELLRAEAAANSTQMDVKSSNQNSVLEIDPLHMTPWYFRNKRLLATFIGDESICWQVKKLCHQADIDHRQLTARQLSLVLADKMHKASLSSTIIPCNIMVLDLQNLDSFSIDLSGNFQLVKAGAIGFQNSKINQWMERKGRKLAFDILARMQNKTAAVNHNITAENSENVTCADQSVSFNAINQSLHSFTVTNDLRACFEIWHSCQQDMLPLLHDDKSGSYSVELLTVHYEEHSNTTVVKKEAIITGPYKLPPCIFHHLNTTTTSHHQNNSTNKTFDCYKSEELSIWSEAISRQVSYGEQESHSSSRPCRRWKCVL